MTTSDPFGRSPLHPLAVGRENLALSMELVTYNRHTGERTPYTISCGPFQKDDIDGSPTWCLRVATAQGEVKELRLADLGIAAYSTGRWHRSVFTIRARDVASLPPPIKDEGVAYRDLTFLHPPTTDHPHQNDPWYDVGRERPTNWAETMVP